MSLADKDLKYIWHPYTHQKDMLAPIPVASAKGALLFDTQGNEYIDGISSWWVNLHGHAHPFIAKKIYKQAKKLEHVIFAGFTHKPAIRLAKKLLPLLPGNFEKVFYSDNGSTSVEVALKMALQFWLNGDEKRTKIIALRNSYHGDTFGAMSVSARSIFTKAFDDKLFEIIFIDAPTHANIAHVKLQVEQFSKEIACFIYEPLLQGAGGMKMYDPNCLNELLAFLQKNDIICIADEVLTGFYRTGKMFAGEFLKLKADIICLSKGITGGTMALGLTACTRKIYDLFVSDDKAKTFYHGHSFTANPLACAAALASLSLLKKKKCKKNINKIVRRNKRFLSWLQKSDLNTRVKNLRQSGTVIAFEIITTTNDNYLNSISNSFTAFCLKRGVYLRSLGNTIYIMPPYCITKKQLNKVYGVIEKFLAKL
ncbi:MAG: adenosylmethionine--8-amino-7-oxononanoate transaminase [Ginsengibacter sp.]